MKQDATTPQFSKLINRMMPGHIASMGEGKLVAAIIVQAWADADKRSSRVFFTEVGGALDMYCDKIGMNAQQIREIFSDHNRAYKAYREEIAV